MKLKNNIYKTIRTNIGTEVKAIEINGQLVTDSSIYKRVKDIYGVFRITRFSDSWLNAYKIRK